MVNVYELSEIQEAGLTASNGHMSEGEALPRIDPVRGVFITRSGVELQLSGKQVSALILDRLANEGKPKIPIIAVNVLGRSTVEYHPNDPGYLAKLAEWEADSRIKTIRYLFTMGVKTPDIPETFTDEHRPFFPDADAVEMKYLYIASLILDEDLPIFTEAVMGQTMPTAKGVDEAANFTT